MHNAKKIIILIITAGIIVAVVWYVSARVCSFQGNKIEKAAINNHTFYAEVVSSNEKLEKGLGGRNDLCDSCAMLFEFPQMGRYSFWMKNMRFPLDIIWLNQGKIVHIEKNVSESFSGILSPQTDADQVLEINAGAVDKLGIKEGDEASF